jgi:hypothetical protein
MKSFATITPVHTHLCLWDFCTAGTFSGHEGRFPTPCGRLPGSRTCPWNGAPRCAGVHRRPLFTGAGLVEPEHHHPDEVPRLDPDLNVGEIPHDVRLCGIFDPDGDYLVALHMEGWRWDGSPSVTALAV